MYEDFLEEQENILNYLKDNKPENNLNESLKTFYRLIKWRLN